MRSSRVDRGDQALRRRQRRRRHLVRRRSRGGLRPARRERGRQDDDGRDPRGPPLAHVGRPSRCSASTPPPPTAPSATASASSCSPRGSSACSPSARCCALYGQCYRRARPVDECVALVGLERVGRQALRPSVGRTAAAPRPRPRDRRLPRAAVPRRADDRLRSGGPPRRVGADPLAVRRRHHRAVDVALPRRGRASRRSRRRPAPRPHGRRGHAGRSSSTRSATRRCASASRRAPARSDVSDVVATSPASSSTSHTSDRADVEVVDDVADRRTLHALTGWALERGLRARRPGGAASVARGPVLDADPTSRSIASVSEAHDARALAEHGAPARRSGRRPAARLPAHPGGALLHRRPAADDAACCSTSSSATAATRRSRTGDRTVVHPDSSTWRRSPHSPSCRRRSRTSPT